MWFAVAILGIIGIACGVTLLPGGTPPTHSPAPPAATGTPPAAMPPAAAAPGQTVPATR